jgi:hypothetical protein
VLHLGALAMKPISDALELLTAQHEQIEDLYEQVRQIGDEAAFVELVDKLTTHLALEQELFYPTMRLKVSSDVMTELHAEHAAIRQVLSDLTFLNTRDDGFRTKLTELGSLLYGHSAWQEDELFTKAAETMSNDELAGLCVSIYNFDAPAIAA